MTFEEWYQQEGYLMTGSGCSHEVVARAAFFVASQQNSDEIESLRARVAELEYAHRRKNQRISVLEAICAARNGRITQMNARIRELEPGADCKGAIIIGGETSRIPGLSEKALQAMIDLGVEHITTDHRTFMITPIQLGVWEPPTTNECNHRQYGPPVKGHGGKIKRW